MSALSGLDDAAWASPWRHVRVGEKVAVSFGLILTALLLSPLGSVLVIAVSFALLVGWAKVRPTLLVGAISIPAAFIVLSALTTAIGVGPRPAETLWAWSIFSIQASSLHQAGALMLRAFAGTLAVFVLAMTTPMVDLLSWLRKLRIPEPALEIAGLTYTMIFGAWASFVAVHQAQTARLSDSAPRKRRWENLASGLGSVALRTWTSAERLNDGLAGRGYTGSLPTLPRPASLRIWPVGGIAIAAIWAVVLALP